MKGEGGRMGGEDWKRSKGKGEETVMNDGFPLFTMFFLCCYGLIVYEVVMSLLFPLFIFVYDVRGMRPGGEEGGEG